MIDKSTNPFDELFERVGKDPNIVYESGTLAALAKLKEDDRPAFERLRKCLKSKGVRVAALDKAIAAYAKSASSLTRSQFEILLEIANECSPFHTPDGTAFVDVNVDGHRETHEVDSGEFRQYLQKCFYQGTKGAAGSDALKKTLALVGVRARYEGPERTVHVRTAQHHGGIVIDLCDPLWRAVWITKSGWSVVDEPPCRFRRTPGMLPLPTPEPGGSISDLRPFLNLASEDDSVLAVSWVLAALCPDGPYPVLALGGEQGSAKSTFARILRALTDPNDVPLRSLPRSGHHLFISANNAHVLAFDNVSAISPDISDTLCTLSTGGGHSARRLFTDRQESIIKAKRPIILNGIEDVIARADLADRAIFLNLKPIADYERRSEVELWSAFERSRPRILGALMDGLVRGLERLRSTHLTESPRMADFAKRATACETAFWSAGTFENAYARNRHAALFERIDADAVAFAVHELMRGRREWSGTASQLLLTLGDRVSERQRTSKNWPSSPKEMSERLKRAMTTLRQIAIEAESVREGHDRTRMIHLRRQ